MKTSYPALPPLLVAEVILSSLTGQRRSFMKDSRRWAEKLAYEIRGAMNLPNQGPAVVVMNHYHRPGFRAWWFVMALQAASQVEMHWTMSAAWTDDGTPGAKVRALVSPLFLPRLAMVYGFTSMPPMPPRPKEVEARAKAVRSLLRIARKTPPPILALSPEGQDSPNSTLMIPHPGVGRLLLLLNNLGYFFHPVGVFETDRLVLSCGERFRLPQGISQNRDETCARYVMDQIAKQLPDRLVGNSLKPIIIS